MNLPEALPQEEDREDRRRFRAAGRLAARAYPLRVEVVRTREAFDRLAAQWAGLEERAAGAVLFQGAGWARAIFDFEAARGNGRFEPVIATLHDGQRLAGVLPLERVRTGTRAVLAPLGHAFGQYSDVLIAEGLDPSTVLRHLLAAAIEAAPCDGVSFLKVRDDSMLARAMPPHHVVTGVEQGAPYVALDGFADFSAYFATLKAKTRKNMRNARNRLEREGAVTHHVAQSVVEAQGVVCRTMTGRAGRLREQGLSSRAFRDGAFAEFCKGLPERDDLAILAMSLRHGDEPIAEQWGFVHKKRYYAFVASRDFSNSEESPGKLHLGEVIRTCAECGLADADLMVPAMPYKLTWATEVVAVRDYALAVTPRGMAVLHLWDRLLRPLCKRAVLAMPRWLRSLVMRLAGRSL